MGAKEQERIVRRHYWRVWSPILLALGVIYFNATRNVIRVPSDWPVLVIPISLCAIVLAIWAYRRKRRPLATEEHLDE